MTTLCRASRCAGVLSARSVPPLPLPPGVLPVPRPPGVSRSHTAPRVVSCTSGTQAPTGSHRSGPRPCLWVPSGPRSRPGHGHTTRTQGYRQGTSHAAGGICNRLCPFVPCVNSNKESRRGSPFRCAESHRPRSHSAVSLAKEQERAGTALIPTDPARTRLAADVGHRAVGAGGVVPGRVGEVRAGEVRACEVRACEVRAAEVRAAEVRGGEVRA